MRAHLSISEPRPPDDPDSPLAFSMEGYPGQPPPPVIPFFWAPGWNSPQAVLKFQEEVNGPLRGGDPGRRLIEPGAVEKPGYFRDVPEAFSPPEGRWLLLAIHHVFGSEELSMRSGALSQLAPEPYVALNPEDAARLGIHEGHVIQLTVPGMKRLLPFRPAPGLPTCVAGIPAGLTAFAGLELPAWAELSAVGGKELEAKS
jgi:NADH-quinone oxidoreductase subunit G